MTPALSIRQLRELLDVVGAIAYDPDRDAFTTDSLAAVMIVTGALAVTYSIIVHGPPCASLLRLEVARDAIGYGPTFDRVFSALCCRHPLNRSDEAPGGVRITWDHVTPKAFAQTAWYRGLCQPLGRLPQAKVLLPSRPDGGARALVLDRTESDFGPVEREILELLRPHLVRPIARADALRGERLARGLSARELEVLQLVRMGHSNVAVANLLAVSPHTVRKHLEHAFAKLGAHTRGEAVARTWQVAPSEPPRTLLAVNGHTYFADYRG